MGRRLLAATGVLIAAVSAVVAVAGQGGRWIDILDVSNHFAPLWGLAGLAAAGLCALAARGHWRRRGVLLGMVAAIVAGLLIGPEVIAGARKPAPATGPTLKLIQFNLWGRNTDPAGTLKWVLGQEADIVLTEEAFGHAAPIGKGLRKAYPYWSSNNGSHRGPVMIYSRWPIVARGSRESPPLATAVIDWNGKPVTVAAIHDYWPFPPGIQQRQLAHLAAFVREQPQQDMIMTGDFNAAPWAYSLKRLDRAVALTRRTHGPPTWPAATVSRFKIPTLFAVLSIDQVYAGRNWETVSVRRGPRLGSDHYPVIAVLAPL